MQINRVLSVYFSATGTTKKVVSQIAENLAIYLGVKCETFAFTLAKMRTIEIKIEKGDLVVFGTPVYAGRVPNVLLKYLSTIDGNGAVAVPIVVYGNRNYDDALIELRDILEKGNFKTIAAASFIGEHSFSKVLAKGRPDKEDLNIALDFSEMLLTKINQIEDYEDIIEPINVNGSAYPYRGYYQPRDRFGNSIDILKVKPNTANNCDDCKLCVKVCPMNSINYDDVRSFNGICIKCGACLKICPKNAKYYDDKGYLYHKKELEEMYSKRLEPEIFI